MEKNILKFFRSEDLFEYLYFNDDRNIKFIISNKNFSLDNYKGLVLKLQVPHNSKCFYKLDLRIKIDHEKKIENIFIYKSDKSFDIENVKEIIPLYISKSLDDNEIVLEFIDTYLIKNKINLLITIGCSIDNRIKEILNTFEIFYFEWLNWNNYQVRNIKLINF
jgi:hypothetical protein